MRKLLIVASITSAILMLSFAVGCENDGDPYEVGLTNIVVQNAEY